MAKETPKRAVAKKAVASKKVTPKKDKVVPKKAESENYIICQKCFHENPTSAIVCISCGSDKFAPEYIKKIEKINRNTFVQVTLPQDSGEKRITLYKWWPGGKSSYNINNAEQWEKIVEIVETKLLDFLGWESKEKIIKKLLK